MAADARRSLNLLAAAGLVLGGLFGMLGTLVAQTSLRGILWGIDGSALVMAASLLALIYFRKGNDLVAAGFLVFAIGQGLIVSGAAASLSASVPSFAAGAALWAVGLLLICVPREFAVWTRVLGLVSAILFAFTSARIFWGARLLPTSSPLPYFAYPFLVLTFVGWIWTLLRETA
jgi:hypothetical protein